MSSFHNGRGRPAGVATSTMGESEAPCPALTAGVDGLRGRPNNGGTCHPASDLTAGVSGLPCYPSSKGAGQSKDGGARSPAPGSLPKQQGSTTKSPAHLGANISDRVATHVPFFLFGGIN